MSAGSGAVLLSKLANEDRNLDAYMMDSTLNHLMSQSSNKRDVVRQHEAVQTTSITSELFQDFLSRLQVP